MHLHQRATPRHLRQLVDRCLCVAALLLGLALQAQALAAAPRGLASDLQGHLWVADISTGTVFNIDTASSQIVQSFTPFADIYAGTAFGNNRIRDLAWDGTKLWAAYWTDPMLAQTHPADINLLPSRVYAFDPASGDIVTSFATPFAGHPFGLGWNGTSLLVSEESDIGATGLFGGRVYAVDPSTGVATSSFAVAAEPATFNPRGLAWEADTVWVGIQSESSNQIRQLDATGAVLTSFDSPYGAFQQGLEFDGRYLWSTGSNSGNISRIDPTTGRVVQVLDFASLVAAPVPEPAHGAMLVCGIAIVLAMRARSTQSKSAQA